MDVPSEYISSSNQSTDLEPSDYDIASIRSSILTAVNEESSDAFDDRDIERITVDDHYIRRFVAENAHDMNKTRKNILETLRWRKRKNINDLTIHDVDSRLFELAPVAAHNRDINGCKMFIITVRKHIKTNFETKLI